MDISPAQWRRRLLACFVGLWLGCAAAAGYRWLAELQWVPDPTRVPIPPKPAGAVLDRAHLLEATGPVEEAIQGSRVAVVTIEGVKFFHDSSIEGLARRWHRAW